MQTAWTRIETASLADEQTLLRDLVMQAALDPAARARITAHGANLVQQIRNDARPSMMEVFLAEYGLSTREGIALMCLAEALLRVPDAPTMDALIEDKIAPSDWGRHLGQSASSLVNASTWALMLTGRVLDDDGTGLAAHLKGAVKRLGEPVIRAAVARAMKEMGRAFVLGETIADATTRAKTAEAQGYTYSYDMLGEAARTEADARRYHLAYSAAITAIAASAGAANTRENPGISVKLSALHPRYEVAQAGRVMRELVPRLAALAGLARAAGIGLNVDAEEADRLALSLRVIGAVLQSPELAGWDGFGVVVQAYGRRAGAVIDWLHAQAKTHDRRIMLRLVKGAYWDAEVKRAQVLGLPSFPVWTRKEATDAAYLAHARKLLGMTDRIYPQFATHNAHSVAAIMDMAQTVGAGPEAYEFQRLHGMGEALHDLVKAQAGTRCRIYAPVGAHRDLLAYLVRRLLENGANSSFVNQIVNTAIPASEVATCPLTALETVDFTANPRLATGTGLFKDRQNARGWDLTDAGELAAIFADRAGFETAPFSAAPILALGAAQGNQRPVTNPATGAEVGVVTDAVAHDVDIALQAAAPWTATPATRAKVLRRAADLLQEGHAQIFALLAREAGKTLADAVSELREAVDFLRYYAGQTDQTDAACGIFAAISPWNFPLAIFTGQIAAALAAGNGVIAKPSEETPLIAALAVDVMLRAGVPKTALQLLTGDGRIGAALTADARITGVVFTGSTATAQAIRRSMAQHLAPTAPLIAETGGLNAMVVDSTALPEQAVRDIIASAFQSAGQRCSALRCLYVQQDVAPHLMAMLTAAMDELVIGNPLDLNCDIGPVISAKAQADIDGYIAQAQAEGRVIHRSGPAPQTGHFVPPTVLRVTGIADIPREVFGPVLHVATFAAADLGKVLDAINARGFGLTFGLHSRIDARVQMVVDAMHIGNIYINRNQIGAVVGCQPFGGEGLSGTGPKAGGPDYLPRFTYAPAPAVSDQPAMNAADLHKLQGQLTTAAPQPLSAAQDMAGPTGESNRMISLPRAPILCLGPSQTAADAQAAAVRALGGRAVVAGPIPAQNLSHLTGFSGAIWWGDTQPARAYALALSQRAGPILPLLTGLPDPAHALHHRHICIDTTASGGNAQLLAQAALP